jgi:hypothetical protein
MTTNLVAAAMLIAEAGGEGRIGMEAVWEVAWQRSVERRQTIEAVCLARYQFSCFNGVTAAQVIATARRHPRWSMALEIVAAPPRTKHTQGANHYCTLKTFPYWAKGRTPSAVIRNHKFYRIGDK